ncbi:WD repeat protein [Talaromyces stipitatus ATCC 10500]|uniref:WD repeat protein n=1 Tax=Talaromyces stipitatus (strain ATCC 10500 / CBS 375.48 / QM 6759 / NRRL 1006) TaxID=441959 RepID=B8MLG0_TALSN|nr:WD repeat protein [Talaromyces stipitatus ATCC 10500]EED15493.1 WD repeat protein [Talaromyces stipitatus ATCC 10500]
MASTPWNTKSKLPGPGTSLKITPSNSPILRPGTRSPNKPSPHQSVLSLQTVIGTTTATPNGFSSHEPSRSFALCVGSAAILADIDRDGTVNQRFFRARPTATPVNPVVSFYNQPASPTTPDNRIRSVTGRVANSGGISPAGDWADSSGSRTWTSRERIKAVTSVAISPNGRFLAVGETGYNPRVLIFSTAADAPRDIPLTALTEHTFGVRSLAFSSNSQYLATLGDMNDGFLFVWQINLRTGAARLHSTNKCTSFIRDMCWMGQTLITAGVRHVKVWRLESRPGSPSKLRPNNENLSSSFSGNPKALSGRNCLLGSLGEHTFTCIASVSDREAILCTDSGAICLLDDSEGNQKLTVVKHVPFGLTSVTVAPESGDIWLGGRGRRSLKLRMEDVRELTKLRSPSPTSSVDSINSKGKVPTFISIAYLATHIVTVDSSRAIHVCPVNVFGNGDDGGALRDSLVPAHRDQVLGVRSLVTPNVYKADFYTWSCEGSVNFWDMQGRCRASKKVELEQLASGEDEVANELKVLRVTEDANTFVSGDRYGVLRVLSAEPWKCVNEVRAHGTEITDIVVNSASGLCLIASSGRDRMVQLFKKTEKSFELIQTMDDHVGAVGQLLFMNDGERLLSCSADRTVIVREKASRDSDTTTVIAFLMSKVITLKVSPLSMTIAPDDPDTLVLSTLDRHIQRFDVASGRHIHSFKATDFETTDAVVMSSLTVATEIPGQSPRILVGVSTTDKSIRVYDFERDALLTKEFGHSEGVSDVILLERKKNDSTHEVGRILVSTGLDGVVMIWDLSIQQLQAQELSQSNIRDEEETPSKELVAARPPLRRILSRSELAGFRQDALMSTPTPTREQSPPRIRKKTSRYTLTPTMPRTIGRNDSPPPLPNIRRSPVPVLDPRRSPSPPSPKTKLVNGVNRRSSINNLRTSSIDFRSSTRTKNSTPSEFGSLNMSTEQVCRTLRAYRKKLHSSTDYPRGAKELDRELNLTIHALTERAARHNSPSPDTEVDSSEKENNNKDNNNHTGSNGIVLRHKHSAKKQSSSSSSSSSATVTLVPNAKLTKVARRMPSTPLMSTKSRTRQVSRSRSLDADGEG